MVEGYITEFVQDVEVTTTFAVLDGDNRVVNIIVWDGNTENWQPPAGFTAVAVPNGVYVSMGYTYAGGQFVAPPAPPVPPPTAAEVMAERAARMAQATTEIDPLRDLVDMGEATAADEALLQLWIKYRIAVSKVQTQAGFPASVVWPVAPQ